MTEYTLSCSVRVGRGEDSVDKIRNFLIWKIPERREDLTWNVRDIKESLRVKSKGCRINLESRLTLSR